MSLSLSLLLKKSSLAFSIKLSAAISSIVFNILVAHRLSAEEFGLYSLAMTIGLVLVGFAKFGLDSTVVKLLAISKLSDSKISSSRYYSTAIAIVLVVTIVIAVFIYIFDDFIANDIFNKIILLNVLPLTLLLVLPSALMVINSQSMRGLQHSYTSLFFSGLTTSLFSIFLLLIFNPHSAMQLLKIIIYSAYISCALSFIYCYLKLELRLSLTNLIFAPVIESCLPLWTVALVGLLIQQLAVLALGRWGSLSEIGLFIIPLKISALMSFALVALNTVTAPKFAQFSKKGNKAELVKLMNFSNKILLSFGIISSFVLFIFASKILAIFGEHYVGGTHLLRILIFGQFINVVTGTVVSVLIMAGYEKLHQRNVLYIALLSIVLMLILVPEYGVTGAAIATSISIAVNNLVSLYFVKKYILNFEV